VGAPSSILESLNVTEIFHKKGVNMHLLGKQQHIIPKRHAVYAYGHIGVRHIKIFSHLLCVLGWVRHLLEDEKPSLHLHDWRAEWKAVLDIEMISRAAKAELRENMRQHMQNCVVEVHSMSLTQVVCNLLNKVLFNYKKLQDIYDFTRKFSAQSARYLLALPQLSFFSC
jgi:hypothetical protein